jgi:hypothetical protein
MEHLGLAFDLVFANPALIGKSEGNRENSDYGQDHHKLDQRYAFLTHASHRRSLITFYLHIPQGLLTAVLVQPLP